MTELPPNATLRDLTTSPKEREEFVRRALGIMAKARREHGSVRLRMGRTGGGKAPNYRIELEGGPLYAINGANHQPWAENDSFDGTGTWSDIAMSYEDVEALLGALRSRPKRV